MTTQPEPDPMADAVTRLRAAADQWGKAVGDAVKLAFRRAVVNMLAEDFGDGPWLLHPDGRVERYMDAEPEKPDDPRQE